MPPPKNQGSFNLGSTFGGGGTRYTLSYIVTITLTVKATWTHDPNAPSQNDTTDPAPPTVWLCESSQVDWSDGTSGSLNDGFGDPPVANQGSTGQTASTSPGTTTPPAHWTNVQVGGNVATLPSRTLKAEADYSDPSQPHGNICTAHIDNYSITVHPTPYNFRRTPFPGETPPASLKATAGALEFHYSWDSTDGNIANLTTTSVHENVDAPSSPSVNSDKGVPSFAPDYRRSIG